MRNMELKNKEFKFVKLGEFNYCGCKYVVFFNEFSLSIDYFYLNKEMHDVECWTLNYNNARKVLPKINTFERFISNYKLLWQITHSNKKYARMYFLQTFPFEMWEEQVMNDFKNVLVDGEKLTEEQIKKINNEWDLYEAYELQKLMVYTMIRNLLN